MHVAGHFSFPFAGANFQTIGLVWENTEWRKELAMKSNVLGHFSYKLTTAWEDKEKTEANKKARNSKP